MTGEQNRCETPTSSISAEPPVLYTTGQRAVHGVFISRTEIEHLIDCSWQFSLFVGLASAAVFFGGGVLISYLSVSEKTPFFNGVALSLGIVSIALTVLFGGASRSRVSSPGARRGAPLWRWHRQESWERRVEQLMFSAKVVDWRSDLPAIAQGGELKVSFIFMRPPSSGPSGHPLPPMREKG